MSKVSDVDNEGRTPGCIVSIDKEGINVACSTGCVKLITIQAPGKGQVKASDLARSRKEEFCVGTQFGR